MVVILEIPSVPEKQKEHQNTWSARKGLHFDSHQFFKIKTMDPEYGALIMESIYTCTYIYMYIHCIPPQSR